MPHRPIVDSAIDTVAALEIEQAVLPHGGTVADYRRKRAEWAATWAEQAELVERLYGPHDAPFQISALLEAAGNARGIAGLLEWLARQFGPGTAYRAAAILQDLAVDGDTTWDSGLLD